MSLATLLNRPCLIVREVETATLNDYGDPLRDEEIVETVCELQQTRRDEPSDEGELSRTTWLLVLPALTSIRTGDAVEVDGARFEVVGDPEQKRNPRTQTFEQVEATLIRTAGSEDAS